MVAVAAVFSFAVLAQGQNAAQKYLEQLKTTDELREAVWGVKAVRVGGGTVAEYASRTRMMPASNVKVFTTGLALNELGADYRFRTRLAYSGSIEGGVLKGDLYIVGGGDPTIGARDSVAFALQKTFSDWFKLVQAAGIRSIEGCVVGDGRWLDCEPQNVSWQLEDAATGDGAVMTGLGFAAGLQAFTVAPGAKVGDPVKVSPQFPETPWMNWSHTAVTGPSDSGDNLFYACTDLAPVASMTGSLPLGTASKRITCNNPFGALTCAYYFYKYLENQGIIAGGGPADINPSGRLRDFAGEGTELPLAAAHYGQGEVRLGRLRRLPAGTAGRFRPARRRRSRPHAVLRRQRPVAQELRHSRLYRPFPYGHDRNGFVRGLSGFAAPGGQRHSGLPAAKRAGGRTPPRPHEERQHERRTVLQRLYPLLGRKAGEHHRLFYHD